MIELVVSLLIRRVGDLLIQERAFLGNVSGKIELLQNKLERMQGYLKDANKRQDEDESVRICVSQIRELAYDAEDVIQSFFVDIESRRQEGFMNTLKKIISIPIDVVRLHTLGNKIKAINGKITDLTLSLQTYKINIDHVSQGSTSTSGIEAHRKTYGHTDEDNTIGLDKDVQILLEKLTDRSKRHQVISICGMGGLGKSTLAKKLFKHKDVLNHFQLFAWIFVSQQFQMRQILQDILIKLTSTAEKERILKMNGDEIASELYELQKSKKCLVVIDDLWNEKDWIVLKHAFPIGNIQGTIVLTTRTENLGRIVDPKSFIHEPRTLTDEESWKLFQMKAFPRKDYPYLSEMEMQGKKMVEKCSGLPLAIIVLGGVLAKKSSLDEWNSAHQSFGMYLRKGETSEYSTIHAVLAVSYSELPYHLKPCFLSLSQFPEDFSITTRTLFQLWMAESIVTNQSNEEAQGYLRELIDRCLVQIGDIGILGGIKSCRLHDLVRDLTLSLSKANKENFLEIIESETENFETHRILVDPQKSKAGKVERCPQISKARRILVGPQNQNQIIDLISLQKNCRLRTLIGQNCELKASSLGDFKMLRTLRLINCKIQSIEEIGKLIHLKYVSIEGERGSIDHIPSSLRNLRHLQTFICHTSSKKLRISRKIFSNFQELRYISIQWINIHLIDELGDELDYIKKLWDERDDERDDRIQATNIEAELKLSDLTNLRTLRTSGPIGITNLENLPNLKKLQLLFSDVKSFSNVLNGLSTLYLDIEGSVLSAGAVEEILLGCPQLQNLRLDGEIENLPKYHQDFTPKLTKLSLESSRLKEDPMPLLENFPNLTFLLLNLAFVDEIQMVCSSKGFPRLKTLKLKYLDTVFDWQVNEGSMPNLSHLFIEGCRKLKMVPDGIKFIKNLSHFEIKNMRKQFLDRVGENGEDYDKIRHVPSILIKNDLYWEEEEEEYFDVSSGDENE